MAGKVALVTGAAAGVGRAIGPRLAREGIAIAALDISGAAAGHVASEEAGYVTGQVIGVHGGRYI